MVKFAANISTMFQDAQVLDRIDRARSLGFEAIEWLHPWVCTPSQIRERLDAQGVRLVLVNTALGDASQGDRGIGAIPGREADFQEAIRRALDYVTDLNIPAIHVMAGIVPPEGDRQKYLETFISNLLWANEHLQEADVTLLVEPLNRNDAPGYLISTCAETQPILAATDHQIKLQFDFYHLQITQGNLATHMRRHIDDIKHVQFSSVPGRYEPQYGEVNAPYLFRLLDELGYNGWIGCEYRPKYDLMAGIREWGSAYGLG